MKALDEFKNAMHAFRCPLCGGDLSVSGGSLVCEKRHCFDISAKGYVNFLAKPVRSKYQKELFECRRAVFRDGFYRHILEGVIDLIKKFGGTGRFTVLDAGCGEGYYALGLKEAFGERANVAALDIAKDAVIMAARGGSGIHWMVADITNIPLRDGSADVIANIFTPSSYSEFSRVLKDGGLLVKVIPTEAYLKELREIAKEQLINKSCSTEPVTEHFGRFFDVLGKRTVSKTLPVTKEQLSDFLKMTPMMLGVRTHELDTEDIKSVTIEAEILAGKAIALC
ncbi:MAG: 23S rRNA (guanine(745)-N(1))-methyltransferase [Firmicutes bacterium ADurb.Bin182]|nr:MAG: 23S rRNA (guanine(745)-N(1))-methyltransferase [Firmicutes bacterium ADurb.Bin182]